MCGINGIFCFNGEEVEQFRLEEMNKFLYHRGPDQGGFYCNNNIGLGHRRLSIIDLSQRARQPLLSEDGRIVVVCNGEVYNYKELQGELKGLGHVFMSESDNEVIVHGYEEWGVDVLERLDGMWAFALWDVKCERLFLARDRIGKRPLVYYQDQDRFVFSSEINALMSSGLVPKEIDKDSLVDFFTFLYIPHPRSIYRGVKKLPPSHYFLIDKKHTILKKYWDYSFPDIGSKENHVCLEELDRILHKSVQKRLASDVPLGVFLSGGVDSSLIVAIASQYYDKGALKTFSIGFEEQDYNELEYARMVAKKYHTEHHEFIVKPDVENDLIDILKNYGEPYADLSAVPSYYVAKMASEHVKVVLNGDGGDECFIGYGKYYFNAFSRAYQHLPNKMRMCVRNIVENVLQEGCFPPALSHRFRHRFDCYLDSLEKRFYQDGFYNETMRECLFKGYISRRSGDVISDVFKRINENKKLSVMDALLHYDYRTYLTDDLMVKMDIACMAHSMEVRSPLLDPELFLFMSKIPFQQKARVSKHLLKMLNSQKGYLPPQIMDRPKQGFGIPLGLWMKEGLKGFLIDDIILSSKILPEYFNPDFVKSIIDEHLGGRYNHGSRLWALVCFLIWHDLNIR